MAFSGDLESFSLTDVFQKVQQNQDTGKLLVDDGRRPFHIFFREGKVVGVYPKGEEDLFLAGLLARRGGIDEKKVTRILKKAGKTGPVQAAFKSGAFTETEARELLTFYCSERMFDLFSIDHGTFTFEEGTAALDEMPQEQKQFGVSLDPGKLLFEAARRADEWKRIKQSILSSREVFTVNEKKLEALEEMDDTVKAVFSLVDGARTAGDMAAQSPESRFTVFQALAALIQKNLVRPLSAGDATTTAKKLLHEGRLDEAIRVGRKGLETERSNRDLRRIVAEALAKKGEKTKAAGELKLLAFSFVDGGNAPAAEKLYREVLDLDPRDFDARERLFEIVAQDGGLTKALREGQDFADAAKKYGVLDRARDIMGKLSEMAPDNPVVLVSLADIHERSGNRDEAVGLLKRAARLHFKDERYSEAKGVFGRVVFLSPDDEESKARLEEIDSGLAEKRARFRRTAVRVLVVGLVLALALAWVVYDWIAHMRYAEMAETVVTLSAEGKFPEARELCGAFRKRFPFTLAGWRAGQLGETCTTLQRRGSEEAPPPPCNESDYRQKPHP